MTTSLNKLYKALGVSKQSFHQRMNRSLKQQAYEHQLLPLIYELREEHPTMGCRDMYYVLQPKFVGRDKFEFFCKNLGLSSKRVTNGRKTTESSGVVRFENQTLNLELETINQLWVSDITYYRVNNKFYYLTFIMDAFSRKIIGHHVSERLFTEQTTLPALKMATKLRRRSKATKTILHSDGGGQYYDKDFIKHTKKSNLINSMCTYPWENGKAERINGVIKNNYLKHRRINDYTQLKKEVDRSIKLYNDKKPHIALKRLTPNSYEKAIFNKQKLFELA